MLYQVFKCKLSLHVWETYILRLSKMHICPLYVHRYQPLEQNTNPFRGTLDLCRFSGLAGIFLVLRSLLLARSNNCLTCCALDTCSLDLESLSIFIPFTIELCKIYNLISYDAANNMCLFIIIP